jgi:DNA-binding Xre family transcriptional regulator
MNNKFIGSDFDDFLQEEGILGETEQVAVKRVLAMRIMELMREKKLSRTEMARRMNTSRASLNRLLDPENESVTLQTMDRAANALGKHLHLELT